MTVKMLTAANSDQLLQRIRERSALAVNGMESMLALRHALHRAIRDLGVRVEFEPNTPGRVADWFGITASAATSGALGGAALGLFLGALVDHPVEGLVVGATAGGIAGGIAGVNAVRHGWRLRVAWLPEGEPRAYLVPIE